MPDELFTEFPAVRYETWRARVEKDLKGADFDKRLVSRTLEGIVIQPLYTPSDAAAGLDPAAMPGLAPYRRGGALTGLYGERWDVRAEQNSPELARARAEIADDLQGGVRSLWLRFDAEVRMGPGRAAERAVDGLACAGRAELDALLEGVDPGAVAIYLDAGGQAVALCAAYLASVTRERPLAAVSGNLGCDPLGALARDGALPCDLSTAQQLITALTRYVHARAPRLRALTVSTLPYHDAGASATQELGYALATGRQYLDWLLSAGLPLSAACSAFELRVGVAGDVFVELAKLRALRLCWAKLVAAFGGDATAQHVGIHAVTSARTKTECDPYVNMLRATTEAFAALVGGADALTTRGFDEALGPSDDFARRIARNTQTILNEEANVTRVADAAGGSYYIEMLTDALAREAWAQFQAVERRGGMASALCSGAIAADIAEIAEQRAAQVAQRKRPITGVSEFADLAQTPLQRAAPAHDALATSRAQRRQALEATATTAALAAIAKAPGPERIAAAIEAAKQGASLRQIGEALAAGSAPARAPALPLRRHAAPFEALRARCDRHAAAGQQRPRVFLCNLGAIAVHKARAAFASGYLHSGGIATTDNDGFETPELARDAFAESGASWAAICGSDEQYAQWVDKLAPLLTQAGATEIVLAGRPGEHEAAYRRAGITRFIHLGQDVVATLSELLARAGVAP